MGSVPNAIADVHGLVKPLLRGRIHLAALICSIPAVIVLVAASQGIEAKVAATAYGTTLVLLFAASSAYHRLSRSGRAHVWLRRLDHSSIFLLIAGSYTPYAVLLLPTGQARLLMGLVWGGAVLGILCRVFWLTAPRWLYTPIYLALGWAAVFWMPDFYRAGGAAVLILLAAGGLLYSMGAIVYALKRPNPAPHWFGFHEIFHACTVAAYVTHYIAVSLITYQTALAVTSR